MDLLVAKLKLGDRRSVADCLRNPPWQAHCHDGEEERGSGMCQEEQLGGLSDGSTFRLLTLKCASGLQLRPSYSGDF